MTLQAHNGWPEHVQYSSTMQQESRALQPALYLEYVQDIRDSRLLKCVREGAAQLTFWPVPDTNPRPEPVQLPKQQGTPEPFDTGGEP